MSETKDWRKICAACHEGEPPKDCEYYGEPNGCNSPTYGEHPTHKDSLAVGNMAAMFNALKQIDRIVWDKRRHTKEEVEAHRLATEALTRPPRNCDRFTNDAEASKAFIVWYNTAYDLNGDKWNEVSSCNLKHNIDDILHDYIEWLFAEAIGE